MAAQAAVQLFDQGATFWDIERTLGITQRAAIDAVCAMRQLDHCPRCYQLKPVTAAVCEDCEHEGAA